MEKNDKEWLDWWNDLHRSYVKQRNEGMADKLESVLMKAKEVYYTSGETIMSDASYDRFERWLETLRPDSMVLKQVGYKEKNER